MGKEKNREVGLMGETRKSDNIDKKQRRLEAQIKDLQKQIAEKAEENAILKKAAEYFSKHKDDK